MVVQPNIVGSVGWDVQYPAAVKNVDAKVTLEFGDRFGGDDEVSEQYSHIGVAIVLVGEGGV